MATRLESRSAELSRLIEAADGDRQRRIAVRVAEAALAAVPLDEPESASALADLAAGRRGGPGMRSAAALTERLDDLAWDIQEKVDEGRAEQAEYLEAFRRARAVNAVVFALGADDARQAALEAAYEAEAATEDLALIRRIVDEVMGGEQAPEQPRA